MPVRWSEVLDGIVSGTAARPPMVATLRLPTIAGWEPGRVWVDWKVDPATLNERDVVFGGYLATLIDFLGALAFISTLGDSETFTTTGLNVSYFRPVSHGSVRIEGSVLHRGRRLGQVDVTCKDESGNLIARGVVSQAVIPLDGE
jgi:uncharacterized protein (TIGR00369 family)